MLLPFLGVRQSFPPSCCSSSSFTRMVYKLKPLWRNKLWHFSFCCSYYLFFLSRFPTGALVLAQLPFLFTTRGKGSWLRTGMILRTMPPSHAVNDTHTLPHLILLFLQEVCPWTFTFNSNSSPSFQTPCPSPSIYTALLPIPSSSSPSWGCDQTAAFFHAQTLNAAVGVPATGIWKDCSAVQMQLHRVVISFELDVRLNKVKDADVTQLSAVRRGNAAATLVNEQTFSTHH